MTAQSQTPDYEVKLYGSGKAITRIEVSKKDEGIQTADIIIAQYTGTKLKKAEIRHAELSQGKNEIQDSAFTLEADSFKVFLWNSTEGMKPLAETVSEFTRTEI